MSISHLGKVLKNILQLYRENGMKPVVAPELEFYLVQRNTDPNQVLQTPVGRALDDKKQSEGPLVWMHWMNLNQSSIRFTLTQML